MIRKEKRQDNEIYYVLSLYRTYKLYEVDEDEIEYNLQPLPYWNDPFDSLLKILSSVPIILSLLVGHPL